MPLDTANKQSNKLWQKIQILALQKNILRYKYKFNGYTLLRYISRVLIVLNLKIYKAAHFGKLFDKNLPTKQSFDDHKFNNGSGFY